MRARQLISTGSAFEEAFAYSRAVVVGDMCFVAGTTGYDYGRMVLPDSVEEQADNTLRNIAGALEKAGFSMADLVRVVIYLTDPAYAERIAPVLRQWLSEARPVNTMVIASLIRPEMKIEIEATAAR